MTKYRKLFLFLLLGLLAFRLAYLFLNIVDLSEDEAYYWDWSRHPALSYYSKGPMVAYLMGISTAIGGDNEFFVRLPAVILSTVNMLALWWLGLALFKSERTAFYCVLTFSCVPVFQAGAMLLTIDNPLFCFWTLSVLFLWKAAEGGPRWQWLLAGVFFGLGMMAKAVMIFLVPSLLLFLLLAPEMRRWLKSPWPWLAILIGLLFFLPQVYWNATHGNAMFRDFLHKGGSGKGFELHFKDSAEFLGAQIGIISPLIMGALVWAIGRMARRWKRERGSRDLFLLAMCLPVLVFYVLLSIKTSAKANWMIVGYLTPLVGAVHELLTRYDGLEAGPARVLRRWCVAGLLVGVVPAAIVFALPAVYAIGMSLPPGLDPTNRISCYHKLGERMAELREEYAEEGPLFFAGNRYQLCGIMAFYVEDQPETYCLHKRGPRNQYFFINDFGKVLGQNALIVTDGMDDDEIEIFPKAFESVEFVEVYPIKRGDVTIRERYIWFARDFQGWTFKPPY